MRLIKQSIPPVAVKTFDPRAVSSDQYYAVKLFSGGIGFITRPAFEGGNYRVVSNLAVTKGNGYMFENPTLAGLIHDLLTSSLVNTATDITEVHEFLTSKELFQWIVDNS